MAGMAVVVGRSMEDTGRVSPGGQVTGDETPGMAVRLWNQQWVPKADKLKARRMHYPVRTAALMSTEAGAEAGGNPVVRPRALGQHHRLWREPRQGQGL